MGSFIKTLASHHENTMKKGKNMTSVRLCQSSSKLPVSKFMKILAAS